MPLISPLSSVHRQWLRIAVTAAVFAAGLNCLPMQAAAPPAAADADPTPFDTTAKVVVKDSNGPVQLKREEQIAIMFLSAIEDIETDCQNHAGHACSMAELLSGPKAKDSWSIEKLSFDPKVDPNYTYTLAVSGMSWDMHANAKKPGLIGFSYASKSYPGKKLTYSRSGTATTADTELLGLSIDGDSFSR